MAKTCLDKSGLQLTVGDLVVCITAASPKLLVGQQYRVRRVILGDPGRVAFDNHWGYDFASPNFLLYTPGPNSIFYRQTAAAPVNPAPPTPGGQTPAMRQQRIATPADYPYIDKASDDIVTLINSRLRSPTKDEIFQTLINALGV